MQEITNNNDSKTLDGEINILELLNILFNEKRIIISITTFVSTIGVVYSLFLPNIYESKAILTPTDSSGSISRSLQSYAGLVGLAGINLPSGNDESNSAQAMQKINSLSFFENNIMPNIFLPDLMALKSWDHIKNNQNYDENIYDITSNTWVRDYSYPQRQVPSAQESFDEFINENFSSSEDAKTGFVFISIKHQSPFIAKKWTDLIINEVNAFYRQKDKLESEKAVSYLNQQMVMTSLSEVKEVISELLQEETQKLALIEANEYYVFDYIDPPAVMEEKSEPQRALISILSALIGALLSIFFVLGRHYGLFLRKIL